MTFPWFFAKFLFPTTFPGLDFIFSFSMVFHDFPWPWEPWLTFNNHFNECIIIDIVENEVLPNKIEFVFQN